MDTLQKKIEYSISRIKKAEKIALQYSRYGFHVAFSGGKDSQVILELCRMAKVKHKAYFYRTSIDPPQLLSFIRKNYPDVTWIKPEMTMFQLILKKRFLPTRKHRYCCDILKERNGLNEVVVIGIRKQESSRRKKREEFTTMCKLGKDKPLLSPILEWTDNDVFDFIKSRSIEMCELYQKMKRIGCIGCPMSGKNHRKELEMFPNHRKAYIHTIEQLRKQGKYLEYDSAEDALNWWTSGISRKKYLANKRQLWFEFPE